MKRAKMLLSLSLLVGLSVGLHGCITATALVTIKLVASLRGHTATVELVKQDKAKFLVQAKAGEKGQDDQGLAKNIVEDVCRELGVQYRVEEKWRLPVRPGPGSVVPAW